MCNADVNWPSMTCDLMKLDYFLWRTVKDKDCANNRENIQNLNAEFYGTVSEIRFKKFKSVVKNWFDTVVLFKIIVLLLKNIERFAFFFKTKSYSNI